MPIEMKLWQKEGDTLHPLNPGKLDSEQQLEEWIAADASIISPDILLIGRQVQTRYGGYNALPGPGEIVEGFLYGELHYFKSIEEIDKFVNLLKNTGN